MSDETTPEPQRAAFGPWVSPINAFVLIGLDLALRPLERPVRRVVEKRKERR